MGSTKYRPRPDGNAVRDDVGSVDIDANVVGLSDHFFAHLESERVRLASLSAALNRAVQNPGWIFDDLAQRAHRLLEGAAISDVAEVARAADALEQAAHWAAATHATHSDPSVRDALRTLLRVIHSLEPIIN